MTTMIIMMMMSIIKNFNPITTTFWLLAISIMTAHILYKTTSSSWLPFIMIMTFSSGMMTLFMYTASLSPNETNNQKKTPTLIMYMLPMTMATAPYNTTKSTTSMMMFTKQMTIIMMTALLIITMITITSHAHQPSQTMSTSF